MKLLRSASSLLAFTILKTVGAISDGLPYNPTRILTAPDLTYVYIFEFSPQNSTASVLTSLDIHKTISANQIDSITSNITIPFLPSNATQAYTPFIDDSGNITVVTGNCSLGAQTAEIWRFKPKSLSEANGGTWTQIDTTTQSDSVTGVTNFLANGATFSPNVKPDEADNQFYVFGGMCPFANSTQETWASAAEYSASMVSLSAKTSEESVTGYEVGLVSSMGGPIPEAGFTMTGLTPTFSTNQDGEPMSMQQDFLLIGGQTKTAFINMSSVAVYSLPQQSWVFLPVQQPTGIKTDLALRQLNTIVEPRSGHTAILSEDGGSVIVYGGWVGDVTNPATPQLAVLTLGSGYGGNGEGQTWSWSVPEQSGPGPAVGSGLYGHGATMLPGGVMMIAGGYSISSSSYKHKRATAAANQNVFLYNTTSNSWVDSYSANDNVATSGDKSHSGPLSTTAQRTGLGVGLGVGLALLIILILFYIWYTRRLKRKHREQEARLTARSSGASLRHFRPQFLDRGGIDGRGGDYAAVEAHSTERDRVPSGGYNSTPQMENVGSTGLFVDIPSPTRGLRKGLASRPYTYHAAPRYDDGRHSRGSNIHPIVEQDDEDDNEPRVVMVGADRMSESQRKLREVEKVLTSGPEQRMSQRYSVHTPSPTVSNPFADPSSSPNPLGSHPVFAFDEDVTPGGTVRRVPTIVSKNPEGSPSRRPLLVDTEEAFNWIAYQDNEGATEHHTVEHQGVEHLDGRASPTKTDDRTSSTLSERSHASTTSITRTMSTRTGAILTAALNAAALNAAWRAADNPESSPQEERSNPMSHLDERSRSQLSSRTRSRSNTLDTSYLTSMPNAGKSTDSFMTARTSLVQLQSEGEALLGGSRRDDPYQRALAAQSSTKTRDVARGVVVTTPVPPPSRGKGIMGSLRRALTAMSGSERTNSMLTSSSTSHEDSSDPTSSPSHTHHARTQSGGGGGGGGRRAVSDGGALLLSHKRGKKDWDEPLRDAANDWGEPRDEYHDNEDDDGPEQPEDREWDVEGEANKRDFQIMFSVPKTRLRVVNADVERASMRSASEGGVSRAGSTRSETGAAAAGAGIGGRSSVLSLRRGEGEGSKGLATTAEEEGEENSGLVLIPGLGGEEEVGGGGKGKGKGKEKAA